ncbi:peptidoglycan DD-metalloendopeptidase family protein [Halomonas sp. McH1-25]|uniref:murein hydrolase activator EnvC family protein n=1 Tax=unclassified Halomonas TaxID=2609666 RepID=UPI001EF5A8E9|nr:MULTISPECIES: peptidoglycan DD-metalloendopeptidase family protein [unclassified Halomonas]MCG7599595.1 peptidoglycan DD-metalloendopeptidase family protein [Halomonas sp. McH1-25]MCP1342132.1 peptidoglycan DD-metalloendopeptidase family protein [Halomonas sp. FL8]MCP1362763.1 peptidoglycan DD-metalloendopeptidase family protein [Halomonas sp. BBD45]
MPGPGPLRAATMAALLVLTPLGMPAAQERPSEGDAKARVDAIKHDIQALDTRLEDTRAARSDAGRQLEKVETALGEIHHRLDTLQAERRQLDDEIASLEARQRELQAQQAAQRQALGEQVAALYRLGDTPQLKLLLNQDEPARLDRMQTYLNYLAEARRERIEALARLDRELADNRASLTQRRARLDTLVSELDAQSAALASRMRERQALVAKLDARYASEQSRLEDLRQDRAHAERVLEQVRRELKRLEQPPPSTAIAKTQGKLPWPVQGKVVSTFGSGDGVNRNGLLIAAAEGTPVRAIHAGRVVFADWMRGFGNLLIIDHGDDIMSLYAHVQRFDVGVGDRVGNDQVIAAVGNTGGRPSPGLYFEVRRGGEPIDPRTWVSKR